MRNSVFTVDEDLRPIPKMTDLATIGSLTVQNVFLYLVLLTLLFLYEIKKVLKNLAIFLHNGI